MASAALAIGALGAGGLNHLLALVDEAAEVSSLEARVVYVNRPMELLRSRPSSELMGMAPLWAEDDQLRRGVAAVRHGSAWRGVVELATGPVESVMLPLWDARDRVVGCLTLLTGQRRPASGPPLGASSAREPCVGQVARRSTPPPSSRVPQPCAGWQPGNDRRGAACSASKYFEGAGSEGVRERSSVASEPPTQRSSALPDVPLAAGPRDALEVRSRASLLENLGRMATAFAHDFNNMLSVIDGSADLALKRIDPGVPGREPILQIREAARRSARLTRQLLAMSRGMGVEPETLDLNSVIFGLEGLLALVVSERVQIVSELGAAPATVRIVRAQLEQVLLNLAVNARDAMPDGGKLLLRTYRAEAPADSGSVVLEVSDTGFGMPPEVVARAFDAHYTTKATGSGLGLSIVKSVIEEAGGTVAVQSELAAGTTFVIRLPCRQTAISTRPSPRPVERRRVLVVDDEGPVRRAVAKMVVANGLDVIVARDAGEALDLLQHEKVDLLLTDVVMPGMSGIALAEAVADLHPDVAVVFMSGYAHDVILERGLDPSTMIYLQKPFTRLELLRKLATALGAADEQSEAREGE